MNKENMTRALEDVQRDIQAAFEKHLGTPLIVHFQELEEQTNGVFNLGGTAQSVHDVAITRVFWGVVGYDEDGQINIKRVIFP